MVSISLGCVWLWLAIQEAAHCFERCKAAFVDLSIFERPLICGYVRTPSYRACFLSSSRGRPYGLKNTTILRRITACRPARRYLTMHGKSSYPLTHTSSSDISRCARAPRVGAQVLLPTCARHAARGRLSHCQSMQGFPSLRPLQRSSPLGSPLQPRLRLCA